MSASQAQYLFFLANAQDVIATLRGMNAEQRVTFLYQFFLNLAPYSLNREQTKSMKRILSPYVKELGDFLNSEYEKLLLTIEVGKRKEVATKHYIMMKKLERYA